MVWTHFWAGYMDKSKKLEWSHIYIELPRVDAVLYFRRRFERDPCGQTVISGDVFYEDYEITEHDTLESATRSLRGGDTVVEYEAEPDVLIIRRCNLY